jgi:mediator of RNA polymerase II transcription subunit 16, fungi type
MEGLEHDIMHDDAMGGDDMAHDDLMEDLFGADEAVPAADKRLPRLFAELEDSGCCRRVAFSRYGPIAAISPDSKTICSYCLLRDPRTGSWKLSKPRKFRPSGQSDVKLKHLEWNWMGPDLALLDSSGRVFIYDCLLGHAHIDLKRDGSADSSDEMSQVVGMHWLPPHKALKLPVYWGVSKSGDRWAWKREEQRTTGPMNPLDGQKALMCITRGGRLRLLYSSADQQWHERSQIIDDGLTGLDNQITHASFAPDRGEKSFERCKNVADTRR